MVTTVPLAVGCEETLETVTPTSGFCALVMESGRTMKRIVESRYRNDFTQLQGNGSFGLRVKEFFI